MGYRYRVVPIGYEGFVQPRKGQGETGYSYVSLSLLMTCFVIMPPGFNKLHMGESQQ